MVGRDERFGQDSYSFGTSARNLIENSMMLAAQAIDEVKGHEEE